MESPQVRVVSSRPSSEEEDRLMRFRVMLQQTGGDPSSVLDMLALVIGKRDWLRMTAPHRGSMSFFDYLKEIQWSREDLLAFVQTMHHRHERPPKLDPAKKAQMEQLRRDVRDLLNPALAPVGGQKGNQNAIKLTPPPITIPEFQHQNSSPDPQSLVAVDPSPENERDNVPLVLPSARGNNASHAIRRLRGVAKKKPEIQPILEQVLSGQLSANAGAIKAGIRQPSVSIPLDPQAAGRRLLRHFKGDRLAALIDVLRAALDTQEIPRDE
jgi:hypothetical protein